MQSAKCRIAPFFSAPFLLAKKRSQEIVPYGHPSELRRYAPRNDKLAAYGKTIAGNNQSVDFAD